MRWNSLYLTAVLLQLSLISIKVFSKDLFTQDCVLTNVLLFFQLTNASSQGVFQLKLKSFMNNLGKDSQGHCCDGFRTSSGKCSGTCATKFRICLKHYQATIDPVHECTFGEEITPVLGSNSLLVNSRNPIIEFALDFKWPGTFSLIIEAWHENNKTSGKNKNVRHEKSVGSQQRVGKQSH